MENYEDKIQDKYFDSIRKESYKESFNDVGNWLRREAAHASSAPAKKNYAFFRFVFSEGRMKFAYLFIILILAGITSNFSVTRSEMVGSVMSWTVDKQKTEAIKKIDNLDWIDKSQLVVEESKTENGTVLTYKMLMPAANTNEIESYKTQLANIKEIMTIDVQPISEPVKQPLYAVAMEKIFNYDYDKNYANPEEVKNSVYEQLKYAGLGNYVGFNMPPNGVAGKMVSFNISEPESVRIRIHDDIVYNYDLDRALDEMDNIITPIKFINDSVIKKMIVRINGENINPGAVLYEVHRSLDTLHLRLKHGDINRRDKMERFRQKMEKFNEGMEKFNKKMEKFSEQMEKYNDEMEEYQESLEELKNLPKLDFDFEIPEVPEVDVDVDIDIPDVPDVPEFDEDSFKFNFNFDNLDNKMKLFADSLIINIDAEKMNKVGKDFEEKMKKFEEKMKKYEKDMQEKYKNQDTINMKRIYEIETDEDYEPENDEE